MVLQRASRTRASSRLAASILVACTIGFSPPGVGRARADPFGFQPRANAASRALVLAVQQGISSLPPTSGQSFVYEFEPTLGAPVRSERLGPVSLRAPETIERGTIGVRTAISYFAVSSVFGPIDYRFQSEGGTSFARIGTGLDAKVGLADLTLSYGITRRVEANLTLPLVLVDAHASQILSVEPDPGDDVFIGFGDTVGQLDDKIANGDVVLRSYSFPDLGFDFDDGTQLGVGRISVGTKALVHADDPFRLAVACDFYFPSPDEDRFAGSSSASILPRLIGSVKVADWMRLLADVGYDYDFDVRQLRRLVWDAGISFPLKAVTLDLGVGGSTYATPIEWTPRRVESRDYVITALGDNEVGTNSVDVLAGARVRLSDTFVLSGAVTVPVVDTGAQPTVAGTLALEAYF